MLKRLRAAERWIADRLKDLFYGPGNVSLEINRCFVGFSAGLMLLAALWDIHKGQPIDLGPGGLGGGLAGIITAAGLAISLKTSATVKLLKAKEPKQ